MRKSICFVPLLWSMACGGASASPPVEPPAPPIAAPPPPASTSAPLLEPTDAELIAKYTPIFLSLLAARNGASLAEAERSVTIRNPRVGRAKGAVQLLVDLTFTIDWATIDKPGLILLRGDAGYPLFATTGLPAGEWLTEAQLATVRSDGPFGFLFKELQPLPIGKHLAFRSRAAAMNALPGNTGARFENANLFVTQLGMPGNEMFLEAQSDPAHCIMVRLDLLTGAATREKGHCGPIKG